MDLNALRYFLVIAQEQHISRAAERLQMAQPNLTRTMRKLEEEIGFVLLDRSNKRQFALTPGGQFFLDELTRLLPQYEQAVKNARRIALGEREQLVVGYVPAAMLSNILPQTLQAFEGTSTGELILHDLSTQSQKRRIQALREHHLHALLAGEPCNVPGIEQKCVSKAQMVVALPHTHRLVQQEILPLSALAGEPWIQAPRHLYPGVIDKIAHLCQQAGFEPRIVRRIPHIQAVLSLVAAGVGIALVTAWAPQMLQLPGVVYRRLSDVSYETELYLLWHTNDHSSLLHTFLNIMLEVSAKLAESSGI